jgi:hypothetical protein
MACCAPSTRWPLSLKGGDVLASLLAYMVVYLIIYPSAVVIAARLVRGGPAAPVSGAPGRKRAAERPS